MEMRYLGQIHECTVQVPNGTVDAELAKEILDAFHRRHEALFTYAEEDSEVELVNVEVTVHGCVEKPEIPHIPAATTGFEDALVEHRNMIFDGSYNWINSPVYDGTRLFAGHTIHGPALIEEPTTTIVIKEGWHAYLHESGTYMLTPEA